MRYLSTSLTFAGFTVLAGLAACGTSDAPTSTPGGSSGAAGSAVAHAGSGQTPGAGAAGTPAVGTAGSAGSAVVGSAGSNSSGGTGSGTAGSNSSGGSNTAGASHAGTGGSGNNTSTGGTSSMAGSGGGGSVDPNAPDQKGKTNAKPGDKTTTNLDYLKLGEIRLINNNWGSVAYNCTDKSPSSVYVNADKTFGWSFDRPDCDTNNNKDKPDFPELEFGIHPFGLGSSQATSPDFSSTTLLPKQIKDITSMSVKLEQLKINLSTQGSWDLTFEFWLSKQNPATTQGNAGVYSELMTFWGWQANRWPVDGTSSSGPQCDHSCGNPVTAGDGSPYNLIVQKDNWGSGWKYYQFRTGASSQSFNGTIDVKKLIDYMVSTGGATSDMWVTRLEVGSEIDDQTKGSVSMANVTFEVNGEKRSPVLGQ